MVANPNSSKSADILNNIVVDAKYRTDYRTKESQKKNSIRGFPMSFFYSVWLSSSTITSDVCDFSFHAEIHERSCDLLIEKSQPCSWIVASGHGGWMNGRVDRGADGSMGRGSDFWPTSLPTALFGVPMLTPAAASRTML